MKEHIIQLHISSRMSMETILKNFPPTLLMINSEEKANSKGNHPLEIIYVKNVIKVAEQI